MEPVNLSILVVNCKQYIPSYNWYFCKSGRYFCGTANSPDDICFNEARLKEFNDSDDYVLMPECPGMTDDEAAVVLKWWCRQNNNPYNDDMNNIDGIINVKMRAIITRR
jgi:hypothetical protein